MLQKITQKEAVTIAHWFLPEIVGLPTLTGVQTILEQYASVEDGGFGKGTGSREASEPATMTFL